MPAINIIKPLPFRLCLLAIFFSLAVSAQKKDLKNPLNDFMARLEFDTSFAQTIYRIVYDFNGDGLQDVAYSSSITWGNAGGDWLFYFKKPNKKYYYYDMMETMHSLAYSIVKQKTKPNILISYGRSSCCSGGIGYFSIAKHGFKRIKVKQVGYAHQMSGDEVAHIVCKELAKGKTGKESAADLKCLLSKSQSCWEPER